MEEEMRKQLDWASISTSICMAGRSGRSQDRGGIGPWSWGIGGENSARIGV